MICRGVNFKGAVLEVNKKDLRRFYGWSRQPFVVYQNNPIELTNQAWGISKGDARRNPAFKFPKKYLDYDFCVIKYGKQTYPRTPKLCLINPAMFNLAKGNYPKRKFPPTDTWFFDLMNFLNGFDNFSEPGL